MSETAGPFDPGNEPAGDGAGRMSAGALLRHARESAGLHIAALAVALKVPVRKLEALEADRFDLLPDAVFIRALASSVCRTLKIDPAPVLERLPQTGISRLAASGGGINVPFKAADERSGPPLWSQMSRPAVLAGLVLLLAALVLIFLPAATRNADQPVAEVVTGVQGLAGDPAPAGETVALLPAGGSVSPATPGTGSPAAVFTTVPAAAASAPVNAPLDAPVVFAAPATAAPAVRTVTAALTATAPAAAASVPASAPVPAVSGNDTVIFKASGDSWIEVTDAGRVVVLRRLLKAGESVGVSGNLPLSAVVGRADVTQVQVRGKALDLTGVARDNVARFEVR